MRRINIILISMLVTAIGAAAQQDFRYTINTNPFLTGANPANFDKSEHKWISVAEAHFNGENGRLIATEESPNCFDTGIHTESFAKISDRIAFYGKMSYTFFNKQQAGGQIMMDPKYNPVQFLESTDTTTGVKMGEKYHLSGGMTYTFNSRWSAGIRIDYEGGDQSKRRDPRFLNYWMDLGISAGASFNASDKWNVGLSVKYRHTNEEVRGGVYGTTDKQYYVSTDKGNYWGTTQLLDGDNNYMPASDSRPMMNSFIGGTVQFTYKADWEFFNELSFDSRKGYYGKKVTSSPVFFEYGGLEAKYNGTVLLHRSDDIHKFFLSGAFATLGNSENSFEYSTSEGKSTEVIYKGQTKISDRRDINGTLGYSLFLDTGHYRPSFELETEASLDMRTLDAIAYPFYRNSLTATYNVSADTFKSFFNGKNIFTIGAALNFLSGFGKAKDEGSYASGATSKMLCFDNYMNSQFEFDTASRIGAGLGFTYTFVFNSRIALYVTAKDRFLSLLAAPQYLKGRTRNEASLVLGCRF